MQERKNLPLLHPFDNWSQSSLEFLAKRKDPFWVLWMVWLTRSMLDLFFDIDTATDAYLGILVCALLDFPNKSVNL